MLMEMKLMRVILNTMKARGWGVGHGDQHPPCYYLFM